MTTQGKNPATTPIPVQLSEPEFNAFIFPHLSRPTRGPKCKLGYHHLFTGRCIKNLNIDVQSSPSKAGLNQVRLTA